MKTFERSKVEYCFTPFVNSIVTTYLPKNRSVWFYALESQKFVSLLKVCLLEIFCLPFGWMPNFWSAIWFDAKILVYHLV